MGSPPVGGYGSFGSDIIEFQQPFLNLADRIKTGRRKCAPVPLTTTPPPAPVLLKPSDIPQEISADKSEPAQSQSVSVVGKNKRKASPSTPSASKRSKRASLGKAAPVHESAVASSACAIKTPNPSQEVDFPQIRENASRRRSIRTSPAQGHPEQQTSVSQSEAILALDQPLPSDLYETLQLSNATIAELESKEINTTQSASVELKNASEVSESNLQVAETLLPTTLNAELPSETPATDARLPRVVLEATPEHVQISPTITEDIVTASKAFIFPEKIAETLLATSSTAAEPEPIRIAPSTPVPEANSPRVSPEFSPITIASPVPTPDNQEIPANDQLLSTPTESAATCSSGTSSEPPSSSFPGGRLIPVIPSKIVWPLTPEPDFRVDSESYEAQITAASDVNEAVTLPTSLIASHYDRVTGGQLLEPIKGNVQVENNLCESEPKAGAPIGSDPRWYALSSLPDKNTVPISNDHSVQTTQSTTPARSSLKALEQGPKVLVLKFDKSSPHPVPNVAASPKALPEREVPVHRPLPQTPEDAQFVQQVKLYLNSRGSAKEWNNGVGQARRIGYILQLAHPPSDTEVLKLDGEQAAAYLATNAFTTCPILTSGQQRLPLQTPDQFLNELYDNQAKVYIQDPTIKPSPRHCAVRAVAIGEIKARFAENTPGDQAWNCLELATHVEDGLRPAFLNTEDCRLLTKLKHPTNRDKASRYSYEPGWKEVEKWALLAQAGALTEPHQDSHGFSTYITVNHGVFGFGWLSNPTVEERKSWNRSPNNFVGGRWRYVVLRPGQTVYFPGGTIHFVFRLPETGNTLAFGGHVLRCSQVVNWVKILIDEKKNSNITNEELTVSAPAYLGRVEKFVTQALARGDTDRWGGTEACEEFLRLKQEFGKTKKGR